MVRKTRISANLALTVGFSLLLAACAGWDPSEGPDEVEQKVRQPARQDSAGVQVYPLQNPAVKDLIAGAEHAEASGDYTQAAMMLERALRIQPRDPELLQHMAEVQLQMRDYEQALNFAVQSYDTGSRVGEICARNWRTISVAREHLGDNRGSELARDKAAGCMNTKPQGM